MSKDYARRNLNNSRSPKNKRWRMELISVVLAGVVVCFLIGWVYIHKKYPSLSENHQFSSYLLQLKTIFHPQKTTSMRLAGQSNESNRVNEDSDVHFEFYTELPHMQVTVSGEEDKEFVKAPSKIPGPVLTTKSINTKTSNETKAPTSALTNQFILQMGIYKNELEASQLRLSLLLNGCEAEIVKLTSNTGDMYRVQRGPFVTMAEAKSLQRQLQKKGITSVLKKI